MIEPKQPNFPLENKNYNKEQSRFNNVFIYFNTEIHDYKYANEALL
jgi:hypothetical protein